jgi:mannosylglycerate hydrolase
MLFPLLEYLADHPGKKEVVRQLVERKKLLFGPFFVQLHSGHTSGEALIRNLLIGHQKGRLIGDVQKTGFLPMMRGRNSQVPQILAGFNIDAVVIDANVQAMEKLISEFIWEGPDGSKLLVGRVMFRTCEQLTMPVTELKKVIERFTNLSSENVIIYSFYDRTGLEKLPENLEKLSGAAEAEVKVESLSDTVWNIKDSLDIKEIAGYKGEICIENRDINSDNQYDYFLRHSIEVGVVIHRLSNLIQYIIEPWSVISNLMKMSSNPRPEESLWIRFFKNQAFTYLTESSANEFIQTLCDELSSLTDESEKHLKGIVDGIVANIGIENANPKDYFFTIINPLPYSRTEIAEVVLEMPSILNRDTIVARDIGGREIPFKIISKEEGALFKLDNQDKAKYHCLVELKNIPGMGWKTFQIELNGRPKSFPAIPISAERHALENDYLRIEINENGTLEIFAKETGEFFSEVGYFIDEVDLGQYQADDKTTAHVPITTKKLHPQIKLLYNTPKAAAYRIEYYWEIPKMFVWNHSRRSPRHERINIIEVVSLDRLSRQVDLKIEIHDHAYDHQIKICFPIDFIPENSYTDGFFSVETRNFQSRRGCEELSMRNFVGVSSEESGFAVLSDGINEYQLIQSGRHNTLALTLVRNFQISKAEKPVEEDRLRNEKAEMHLAFYPHLANWESGEILIEALLFNTPLIVRQLTNYAGFLPAKIQFLKVNPDILLFSALKTADDDRSVILRLFNPTRNLVDGEINTCLPIEAARYLTLEEHIIANLEPIDPNRLGIKIFPRKIVTVKIIFKKEIQIYDIV